MHLSYHRKKHFFFESGRSISADSLPLLQRVLRPELTKVVNGWYRIKGDQTWLAGKISSRISPCIFIWYMYKYMYIHIYIYAHLDPFVGFHKWGYPYIHEFIWEHPLVRGIPNGRGAKPLATCSAGSGAPGKVLCVGPGSLELIGSFQGVSGQKSWWTAFKHI